MGEDHYKSRLNHHVFSHMQIIAVKHQYSLLTLIKQTVSCKLTFCEVIQTWHPFAHIIFILSPVILSRLQRTQPRRPSTLVAVFHQIIQDVHWAPHFIQCPLDHSLQRVIGSGDHSSPPGDPRRL